MHFGSLYNTTVNINGHSVQYSSHSLNPFCCGGGYGFAPGGFTPGCFGFGYNPMCGDSFMFGAGAGLGMAAGMMLPGALKLVGQGLTWGFNNIIKPGFAIAGKCLTWGFNNIIKSPLEFAWNKLLVPAWNNGIKPAFKAVGNMFGWLGGKIADGAKWVWNGVKSLFGKKS